MGLIAILSFFIILFGTLFVGGGFAGGAIGVFALLASIGVAAIGLTGLYNFIKHDEMPDTGHAPPHRVPHAR
jgi:hypothetical protein